MKNQMTCIELLEKLNITFIDNESDNIRENQLFWHEYFSDLITIPASVIDSFDDHQNPEVFRILNDYAFRRGFTAAKLQYERGLCSNTNPYIQANNLTNSLANPQR